MVNLAVSWGAGGGRGMSGGKGVYGYSLLLAQFYCDPKTALKNKD